VTDTNRCPSARRRQRNRRPEGDVEGSVAAGIGFSWGKGMLSYEGKMYPVRVQGLSVGELGVTRATGPRLGRSLGRRRLPAEAGDRPMTRFSLIQGGTTP